jgi:YggT family protein
MRPLLYIVHAILQYLFVTAFLLRLLLPLFRTNMRNPITQAVLRTTNPLVMPLRRILPPVGRIDTASVIALLLVQFLTILSLSILAGLPLDPAFLARETALELLKAVLQFYSFALIIYVVISWVAPNSYSPVGDMINNLCESMLRPIRQVIPPLAGLDLSAFFALIIISAVMIALPISVFPFG